MIIDILILIPIGWAGYKGYTNGLLQELVAILHFVVAFLFSFKFVGFIFKILNTYLFVFELKHYPEVVMACSTVTSLVLLMTLGKYLKTEIEFDFPGAWDNIIGGIFGAIKFFVVLSFFIWFIDAFGDLKIEVISKSYLYGFVQSIAFTLIGVQNDQQLSDAIIRLM